MAKGKRMGHDQLVPTGDKCLDCGLTHLEAFPLFTWEETCDLSNTNKEFCEKFDKCNRIRKKEQASDLRPGHVVQGNRVGMDIFRTYLVFTPDEFKKLFKKAVAEVPGLVVEKDFPDEEGGKLQQAILMRDSLHPKFAGCRRVTVKHTITDSEISETWHQPDKTLRQDQAKDMYNHLKDSKILKRSVRMKRGTTTTLSAEDVDPSLMKMSDTSPNDVEDPPAGPGLEAAAPTIAYPEASADGASAKDKDEMSDDEAMVEVMHGGVGMSLDDGEGDGKKKKGKGKGKGKAKGKGSKHDGFADAAGNRVSNPPGQDPEASSVTSFSHGRGAQASSAAATPEKQNSVEHHVEVLNLSKILSGVPLGSELYQARRTLSSLEKKNVSSSESVALRAHIDLCNIAKSLTPEAIGKLSKDARDVAFKKLAKSEQEIIIPPMLQAVVIIQAVKEISVSTNPESLASFADMICPCRDGTKKFDALKPRLRDAKLNGEEMTQVLHKVLVDEFVLSMVAKGSEGSVNFMKALRYVVEQFKPFDGDDEDVPAEVTAFMKDITSVFNILIVVLDVLPLEDLDDAVLLEFLADSKAAKLSKAKKVIKQALLQNTHYAQLMAALVENQKNILSFGPLVKTITKKFEDDLVSLLSLSEDIVEVPRLITSLPEVSTKKLVKLIVAKVRVCFSDAESSAQTTDTLEMYGKIQVVTSLLAPVLGPGSEMQALRNSVDNAYKRLHDTLQSTLVLDALRAMTSAPSACTATKVREALGDKHVRLSDQGIVPAALDSSIKHITENAGTAQDSDTIQKLTTIAEVCETLAKHYFDHDDTAYLDKFKLITAYLQLQRSHSLFDASVGAEVGSSEDWHTLVSKYTFVTKLIKDHSKQEDAGEEGDEVAALAEELFGDVKVDFSGIDGAFQPMVERVGKLISHVSAQIMAKKFEPITAAINTLEPLAGGIAGGGSWKEGLSDKATLQELREKANSTLKAQGNDMGMLVPKGWNELKQASSTAEGRHFFRSAHNLEPLSKLSLLTSTYTQLGGRHRRGIQALCVHP
jgi:hypothetical protein